MTNFQPASTLQAHRPLLLAMEAIGWLHMTGKAHVDFLRKQAGQSSNYDDLRWFDHINPPFPWDDLLGWVKTSFAQVNGTQIAWPTTLAEFLTKHRSSGGTGLLGLLQAAHGMASGIEKNVPKATSGYLGQDATHLWLSSAFGMPQRNLLLDPPEILTAEGWKRLLGEITRILEDLQSLGQSKTADVGAWQQWREAAIGPHSYLRQGFSTTLAETRLPNNDVTLWDQSYVAAALFKSAAAGAILEGSGPLWKDNQIKQKTRWRLLTVGMGTDHYEARAVRIGDWTGARRAIDQLFQQIRDLVEVDLAIGSLLYRDATLQVFSFPSETSRNQGSGQSINLNINQWQSWLQSQIDTLAQALDLETPPLVRISGATRSLVPMTKEIRQVKATLTVPLHRPWEVKNSGTTGHVCPVCLVRHTGNTNDKQQPCQPCRKRRSHRLDDWLVNQIEGDTIWISEVSDANDRVALVTLSLDIEPWLDGTRVDSLRTQAISEWRRHNPTLKAQANPIALEQPYASLVNYVKNILSQFNNQDVVMQSLQDGYQHETSWPSFYAKLVEDRAQAPDWNSLPPEDRARWIVHQLFRKLPSPGRVYRFWRQSELFFHELLRLFREIASRTDNRWRFKRLLLKPKIAGQTSWRDREVYAGRWHNRPSAPFDLLYHSGSGGFITTANLARLLEAEEAASVLKGEHMTLRDEQGRETTFEVQSVSSDVGPLGVYHPVIPLELSPVRFRVMVPLDAASACVDRAVELWNAQFARVWDRLPLRVGVVAFPRMMPFQAVIEAVRNIEDELERSEAETWRVVERDHREGLVALHLQRPDAHHGSELRTVPIRLPDGRTDVFYPYVAVEDKAPRFPLDFQHPDGQVYRHVLDLQTGDGVRVIPSRISTVFLESTAQRFDPIQTWALAEWSRMRGIWRLLRRLSPSDTALHGAWVELVQRRESWRTPDGEWCAGGQQAWVDLVRVVLHDRLQVGGGALDALVEAAEHGALEWALEWHLSALKEKITEVTNVG
jgi:CRISPR-associated Csx11 family protein